MKALHIPLVLLISSLLPLGCNSPSTTNNSTVTTTTTVTTQENNNAFSDLSIYNLPEVWTTQNGDDIALKELKGNVLVVVMIYTSCKTACPILIKDMREIRKQVDTQIPKTAKGVKYLLVSIDDDQWLFLRSNEEQTREFAAVLAVNYKQISPVDFSHSNIISVFNKKGELVSQQEGLGIDYEKTVTEVKKQLAM